MYLDHFNLKELPFRLSADPRFHFLGALQEMAKSQLRQGLVDCDGCMLLTGESGVGKTLLIEDLLAALPEHYRVVQVKLPEITVAEFYRAALTQLGEKSDTDKRTALMGEFETCLERHAAARRIVVVVLDSGELAGVELLQELVKVCRRNAGSAGNLRLVLAGRPSLEKSIAQATGHVSRIALHIRLGALEGRDTRRYVRHRLETAGGRADALVEEDCFFEIQRYTGGVPRLINTLMDAALVLAYNRNRGKMSSNDIRGAVDQLQWVEFNARSTGAAPPSVATPTSDANLESQIGHLRIERDGQLLAEFDLPVGKVSLGRARNNDVRVDSQFISRHHCHVLTTRQCSVIEDLQSQNGILVGGRRVSVHRLRDGDTVMLGDHCLTFSKSHGVPAADSGALFPMILSSEERSVEATKTRVLTT